MPERTRRRPPWWVLITLTCLAVMATIVTTVVRSIGPEPWEQAAIDMAHEFTDLVLPDDPDDGISLGSPDNGKWGRPLEGMAVKVVYREGQTLDTIQHSVETATDTLDLYPAVCIQTNAKVGYARTGQRSQGGHLGCSIFDADKHPVGWIHAWQDHEQITVILSFGEGGRGPLAWMNLDPDDLP